MTEPFVIGGAYRTNYRHETGDIIWQVTRLAKQKDGCIRAFGNILYNPWSDYRWPTWNSAEPESHIRLSEDEATLFCIIGMGG